MAIFCTLTCVFLCRMSLRVRCTRRSSGTTCCVSTSCATARRRCKTRRATLLTSTLSSSTRSPLIPYTIHPVIFCPVSEDNSSHLNIDQLNKVTPCTLHSVSYTLYSEGFSSHLNIEQLTKVNCYTLYLHPIFSSLLNIDLPNNKVSHALQSMAQQTHRATDPISIEKLN